MSKSPLPISPFWTRSSSIPIHLDFHDEREPNPYDRQSEHICQTCSVNSRHQPIHCVQRSPCSPAPPPYRSVASTPSNNLVVPTLNLETSRGVRPTRPALQFDLDRRPRVRFRRSVASPLSPSTTIDDVDFNSKAHTSGSSIPNTPDDDVNWIRKSSLGLGIPEARFKPDPSPIRSPGSETLAKAEKGESTKTSSPNVAQRIEEKLLEYSHSGNVAKRWLLEITSWTISALCMASIIAVLGVLSHKPVPNNWPMGLTLGAYISTLSRIASAALLLPTSEALGQLKWSWFQGNSKKMWDFEIFDNASRGPWGSFLLLVRTKGTTLAALGAAITIFAMALDPFFQQVAQSTQKWSLLTQQSSIPKVSYYSPGLSREFLIGETSVNPDRDVQQIADKYFYDFGVPAVTVGNGTRPDIPVSCPSSNCTWEPYDTLGVCSECADVADKLEFGCLTAPLDWVQNATSYVPYENGTMCGWFFNATGVKPMLMSGYQIDNFTNKTGEVLMTRSLPLITNINRRPLFGGSINFKHIRNPITNFVVVTPADGPEDEKMLDSIFRHVRPRASECILSMCVKTIESSYATAGYNETVTHRFVNTTAGPFPWTQENVSDPDISNAVAYFYLQDITLNPNGPDNYTNYGISNDTAFNIINVFDDYLPSFGTRKSNASATYMKYRTYNKSPTFREYTKNPWLAPRNVTLYMERLATSMTNTLRFSSNENVTGQAFTLETIVDVRWWWLSLPVGLLFLTLIFLTATIVRTSMESDRVGVWKNSAIANIIYGLPDRYQEKILASQADGTPRAKAKTLNVRMLPTKDWRISNLASPNPLTQAANDETEKEEKQESRVFQTVEPDQGKSGFENSKTREKCEHETKVSRCSPPPGWI